MRQTRTSLTTKTSALLLFCVAALLIPVAMWAQTVTVTGSVSVIRGKTHRKDSTNAGVVVWLTPVAESGSPASTAALSKERFTLLQKDKKFEPHVLVVPVGAEVRFPNQDPFFHNVFSLFDGKRFDLGLYEAGTARSLHFDRPGISYLFCNIHPDMSAVIIALETHYYSTSNKDGQVTIPNVPAGAYVLHVWNEGSSPDTLKGLSMPILVSASSTSFETLLVPDNATLPLTHKNKYGRDYEDPAPPGPAYSRP